MRTRIWLASAATAAAVVAIGSMGTGAIAHGQDGKDRSTTQATKVEDDVRRAVEEATRAATDAVRDVDIEAIVSSAMQEMPGIAVIGGRPRLGVSTRDVTAEEAKAAGLDGITGAYVTDVASDSAAAKAGLEARDIIVSVDGETIRSARQLVRVVGESPDGRALAIAYVRGTTRGTATATLETRSLTLRSRERGPVVRRFERRLGPAFPEGGRPFDMLIPRGPAGEARLWIGRGRLGIVAQSLNPQLAAYFGVEDGVLVTQVNEESPAAKAGMKAGDVITAVNGKPVKDPGDITGHLRDAEGGKDVTVAVTRDRKSQSLTITVPARSESSGGRTVTRIERFTA